VCMWERGCAADSVNIGSTERVPLLRVAVHSNGMTPLHSHFWFALTYPPTCGWWPLLSMSAMGEGTPPPCEGTPPPLPAGILDCARWRAPG
jgi:hypothetical protein